MSSVATPTFALAFGLFLLCGETCLHIEPLISAPGELSSWPIYVWAAGFFLIYGAARARRDWLTGGPWLIAAWAFNASLLLGAFFDLFGELVAGTPPPADEWIPLPIFVSLVALLLLLSLLGLVATVRREQAAT